MVNKQGKMSIVTILFVMITIIAVFSGLFMFYISEANQSGVPINNGMNASFSNITARQAEIDNTTQQIRDKASQLAEAQSGGIGGAIITTVAGFSATIQLMFQTITTGLALMTDMFSALVGVAIPGWAFAAVFTAITAYIVFAIIKIISGRIEI